MTIVNNICRPINRDTINILSQSVHESWETNFSYCNYNSYLLNTQTSRKWNYKFRPLPERYSYLDYIPEYLDLDVVISHTKFSQFAELYPVAQQLQLPFISVEHTDILPFWSYNTKQQLASMRGQKNVFISNYSVERWRYSHSDNSVIVIPHGIQTEIFKPNNKERLNQPLTVANDFKNRNFALNYDDFLEITKDIPRTIVGDTAGVSEAAKSVDDLVNYYQTHRIFINCARLSPIPMSLLEACSCGCAPLSVRACGVSEYLTNGYDAILCDTNEQMKKGLRDLMNDESMATELGNNAAKTIREKFNLNQFVDNWKRVIGEVT